jgi:hypothetical protein
MRHWVSNRSAFALSVVLSVETTERVLMVYRAALCQVFDSIFRDVPMGRVKFNVNTEYAYLANFKILQSTLLAP